MVKVVLEADPVGEWVATRAGGKAGGSGSGKLQGSLREATWMLELEWGGKCKCRAMSPVAK